MPVQCSISWAIRPTGSWLGFEPRSRFPRYWISSNVKKLQGSHTSNFVSTRSSNYMTFMHQHHSGAPWVRKCGKIPIRENLAITWPYTDRPTARPSVPQACQRKISGSLWWGFFGAKTNGNPRFLKHKQLRSFYCNEIGSSAFKLG